MPTIMSTVVDARVSAAEFALEQTLTEHPEARFEACQAVANPLEEVMPFLWGVGPDLTQLSRSLEADPSTRDVEVVDRFDEESLYRIEWGDGCQPLLDDFLNREGSALLDAHTRGRDWYFRLVFPDDCVQSVEAECASLDLDIDLDRVYSLSDTFACDYFQLTQKQYETILVAYEEGYYDIPQQINLKKLAQHFDVSHQALSQRLRRGHEVLIANGLGFDPNGVVVSDLDGGGQMTHPPLAGPESR